MPAIAQSNTKRNRIGRAGIGGVVRRDNRFAKRNESVRSFVGEQRVDAGSRPIGRVARRIHNDGVIDNRRDIDDLAIRALLGSTVSRQSGIRPRVALVIDGHGESCGSTGVITAVEVGDRSRTTGRQQIIQLRDRTTQRNTSRPVTCGDRHATVAFDDGDRSLTYGKGGCCTTSPFIHIANAKAGAMNRKGRLLDCTQRTPRHNDNRSIVYREDVKRSCVRSRAERSHATVGSGVGQCSVSAAGLVPRAKCDRVGNRPVVVGIRLKVDSRVDVGSQAPSAVVGDRA